MTMNLTLNKIVTAIHAVLAGSGVSIVAASLADLHGAGAVAGASAGSVVVALAGGLLASHSQQVAEFAHTLELDAAKVLGPGLVTDVESFKASVAADVEGVKAEVAKYIPADQVAKLVDAAVAKVEAKIPGPVKVAVADVRPLVEEVLAAKFTSAPAPAVVAPLEPAPVAAPASEAPPAA